MAAPRGRLQGRGIRPGGLGPALHRDRDQTGVREHRVDLLALEAVVVGDVRARADAQGLAREPDQTAQALRVVQLVVEQIARDGALGEVVHPLPASALRAHHLAVHQRALDGDLRARPVPPLAGLLRAAQVGGRERAFGLQLLDDLVVRAVRQVVVPVRAGAVGAAAEREVRPLLDGEDAGGVRPVLEGVGAGRSRAVGRGGPVGAVHRLAADRAQAGVRDEFVGAGQDGDRVELDRAQVPQYASDAAPAVGGAQETLGAQGDSAGLVGGEFGGGARQTRHGPHDMRCH